MTQRKSSVRLPPSPPKRPTATRPLPSVAFHRRSLHHHTNGGSKTAQYHPAAFISRLATPPCERGLSRLRHLALARTDSSTPWPSSHARLRPAGEASGAAELACDALTSPARGALLARPFPAPHPGRALVDALRRAHHTAARTRAPRGERAPRAVRSWDATPSPSLRYPGGRASPSHRTARTSF